MGKTHTEMQGELDILREAKVCVDRAIGDIDSVKLDKTAVGGKQLVIIQGLQKYRTQINQEIASRKTELADSVGWREK